MSFIRKERNSFTHAIRGIRTLVLTQRHGKMHLAATCILILMCIWLQPSAVECGLLALAAGLVWSAEALNTALELLADRVSTEYHLLTKMAKDVAAGGVLLASVSAAVTGACILLPKIMDKC